jgi:hypothetical protein
VSNLGQLSTPLPSTLKHLPGEPSVALNHQDIHDYITTELDTPVLDEIYPNVWFVGRKAFDNIDPLHRQKIKGRVIVPSEDSKLHMVWTEDIFFVKPIPLCLLNHAVWTRYLADSSMDDATSPTLRSWRSMDCLISIGFLRSYSLLIRHRSDYDIARSSSLIPGDFDWNQWSYFIHNFRALTDDRVAKRYHYGQLRLSRLNWAVRLFRPRTSPTH